MRNLPRSLFVRAGELISAKTWDAVVTHIAGLRLLKGLGIHLDSRGHGTIISLDARAFAYLHAFKCTLLADFTGCTIRRGTVNGKPVLNDGEELSAADVNTFDFGGTPIVGPDRRGWVAVEATFDEKWGVDSAQLVQVADLDTDDGLPPATPLNGYQGGGTLTLKPADGGTAPRARWPIAELIQRESGQFVLQQAAKFNLMHRASIPVQADGKPGTSGRHFFYAAAG